MNHHRLPIGLTLVAILQFVAPLVLPPDVLTGVTPVLWLFVLGVFGLLGWNLLRRKAWARVATIFVQGFSILVHLLVLIGHARVGTSPTDPLNVPLISTFLVSMLLSGVILYYVDLPDVQTLMQ